MNENAEGNAAVNTSTENESAEAVTTPAAEATPDVAKLQKEAADAVKAQKMAEDALNKLRSEHSKYKREHSSVEELAVEKARELEEKARMYDIRMNALFAEKILVAANMAKEDYEPVLEIIASTDEEKTVTLANWIVDMMASAAKSAVKTERDKRLKDTVTDPPAQSGSMTYGGITKEQFRDMSYEQRAELRTKNKPAYQKLVE